MIGITVPLTPLNNAHPEWSFYEGMMAIIWGDGNYKNVQGGSDYEPHSSWSSNDWKSPVFENANFIKLPPLKDAFITVFRLPHF